MIFSRGPKLDEPSSREKFDIPICRRTNKRSRKVRRDRNQLSDMLIHWLVNPLAS